MKNQENKDWELLFDDLPVDDAAKGDHQARLRHHALAILDEKLQPTARSHWLKSIGDTLMKYKAPHWTAAAIAVVAFVWLTQVNGTKAFAIEELVANVLKAHTARYDMVLTVAGRPEQRMKAYYLAPAHFRQELVGGHVNIADWKAGKMVGLDPTNKRATVFNLVNLPENAANKMPTDQFAAMQHALRYAIEDPDVKVEELGEKEFAGQKTLGFRFETAMVPMTVWADPDSQFPVRIEFTMAGPPQTEVVMENYEFNIDLDESLFRVSIPDGYTAIESEVDVSPVTEDDFIHSLKLVCAANKGQFPDGLDAMSLGKHIAVYVAGLDIGAEGPDAAQMEDVLAIGRGLQFATNRAIEASNVYYAGANVQENDADRPVFWYQPAKSDGYRVIYADYSVKERETAPEIEGAIKLR